MLARMANFMIPIRYGCTMVSLMIAPREVGFTNDATTQTMIADQIKSPRFIDTLLMIPNQFPTETSDSSFPPETPPNATETKSGNNIR
jgi:hypothetical protein